MKKPSIILTLGCIALISVGFGIAHTKREAAVTDIKPALPASEELSPEAYARTRDAFLELADNKDPRAALAELRKEIKTDEPLLRSCHALAHEIGHEAYEKYKDFGQAMMYQDEICNSGYLHGIIESYFLESTDIFATMDTVCASYSPNKYLGWECYHGVGHGVMYYTENDLNKSLALCDTYSDLGARNACVNGVYMENFNTDQKLHHSAFLKVSDPFYPCAAQTSSHKVFCYLYAPTYYLSLHQSDYAGALTWCKSAEFGYTQTCAEGVGSEVMKENINNPALVEAACMSDASLTNSCISGMAGLLVNHYGSLEPAQKVCSELRQNNRQACSLSLQSSASFF